MSYPFIHQPQYQDNTLMPGVLFYPSIDDKLEYEYPFIWGFITSYETPEGVLKETNSVYYGEPFPLALCGHLLKVFDESEMDLTFLLQTTGNYDELIYSEAAHIITRCNQEENRGIGDVTISDCLEYHKEILNWFQEELYSRGIGIDED